MYVSNTESAANGFKKWSVAHSIGSNDNDRPGGAHPMAAIAKEDDLRAVEVAHRLSFRF
jgi:hypothetical protein